MQFGAALGRKGHGARHVGFAIIHQNRQRWPTRPPLVGDVVPDFVRALPLRLGERVADHGGDEGVPSFWHTGRRVAHLAGPTPLPDRATDPRDRSFKADARVANQQLQAAQTAGLQAALEFSLMRLSLLEAVANGNPRISGGDQS